MSLSSRGKEKAVVSLEEYQQETDLTEKLGYKSELSKNRSLLTLLFQSLAIEAVP